MTITLLQGDCLEIMPTLEAGSVDLIVTSPPYNFGGFNRDGRKSKYNSYDDDLPTNEYKDFIGKVLVECARLIKPGGAMYWNHRGKIVDFVYQPTYWIVDLCPMQLVQHIIWNFPSSAEVAKIKWYPRKEDIYYFSKGKPAYFNEDMAKLSDVWKFAHEGCAQTNDHPAPFPVELPKRAIAGSTTKGMTVLDPFAGSGTTMIAAIQAERNAIGIELDEHYFKVAQRRIHDALQQMRLPLDV
jgi:site-specific DNA-methyltransferase (adenine-specific)